MAKLKRLFPKYKIEVIYECEFQLLMEKQETEEMKEFCMLHKQGVWRTTAKRLNPKEAYRGGRNELYSASSHSDNDHEILHFDINSSYACEAFKHNFPIGPPEILIGEKLANLTFDDSRKCFCYQGDPVLGLVQAQVIAPKNMKFPYLQYRHIVGKSKHPLFSLCKTCGDQKKQKFCRHTSPESKKMVSTWTSFEINKAKQLGYEIKILEIWHFKKSKPIFRRFVKELFRSKVSFCQQNRAKISSDWHIQFNENFQFNENQNLSVEQSKILQKSFKLGLNSFLSKFGQIPKLNEQIIVQSCSELVDYAFNKEVLVDIGEVGQLCEITIKRKLNPQTKINLNGNLIYIAMITALARDTLYNALIELANQGHSPLFCDTDSVCARISKKDNVTLRMGNGLGFWRSIEDQRITDFYSLGCKNYIFCFDNCSLKSCISGINKNAIDQTTLEKYKALVKESFGTCSSSSSQITLFHEKRCTENLITSRKTFSFSLKAGIKRRIFQNDTSYPFGFKRMKKN